MGSEEEHSVKLRKKKQEILAKVKFLERKALIDYRQVYHLIRDFLKTYLDQEYEFTISELRVEIKKTYIPVSIREELFEMLDTIQEMEFSSVTYTRNDLAIILRSFEHIVEELIKTRSVTKNIWKKIHAFLFKEEVEPLVISELPIIEKDDYAHVHLNMLVERVYIFLAAKDQVKVKKQYQELVQYYHAAGKDVRSEFYPLVEETYDKVISFLRNEK